MVLITDIPLAERDQPLNRDGMTAEGIIRTYREEYSVGAPVRDETNNLKRWQTGTNVCRPVTLIPEGNPRGSVACV